MDSILTWKQHILFISSKISKSLGIVSRLIIPTDTLLSIYRSLIQAYINYGMKEVLYEVRCLKWNEDMNLSLAGQFKLLSHKPEKFRWLNGIRSHDLCDVGAVL